VRDMKDQFTSRQSLPITNLPPAVSMNEALLVNVFGSGDTTADYAPQAMKSAFSQQRLNRNAAKKSHEEFTLHKRNTSDTSQAPASPDTLGQYQQV